MPARGLRLSLMVSLRFEDVRGEFAGRPVVRISREVSTATAAQSRTNENLKALSAAS